MGIVLGLMAAVFWGLGDFMARFCTRRIGTYRALFYLQLIGLLALTLLLGGTGEWRALVHETHRDALFWVVIVGLLNTVSSLALYRSFETGVLAIVAPIGASYPALTVLLALASGEVLHPARGIGIGAALIGVVLAATSFSSNSNQNRAPHHHKGRLTRGVPWAIAAAFGYGFLFWLLGFRVMPLLGGAISVWFIRLVSLSALAVLAAPLRQSVAPPQGGTWWLAIGIGFFDTAAFLSNNLALKREQVAVASVLASLYGAVTVLLAAIFLREKTERSQWVGIALIFAGIALISH